MNKFKMFKCEATLNTSKTIDKMSFYSLEEFEQWKEDNKRKITGIYDFKEVEINY